MDTFRGMASLIMIPSLKMICCSFGKVRLAYALFTYCFYDRWVKEPFRGIGHCALGATIVVQWMT